MEIRPAAAINTILSIILSLNVRDRETTVMNECLKRNRIGSFRKSLITNTDFDIVGSGTTFRPFQPIPQT